MTYAHDRSGGRLDLEADRAGRGEKARVIRNKEVGVDSGRRCEVSMLRRWVPGRRGYDRETIGDRFVLSWSLMAAVIA